MQKLLLLCAAILSFCTLSAQLLSFGPSSLTIVSGTVFKIENLTIKPTVDFTINNNTLDKFTTILQSNSNQYISRVYRFINTTPFFTGSLQINYTDGIELNGIDESLLTLNINDGTVWESYQASTRDAVNNFVLTNGISMTTLKELTLVNFLAPLPLNWLSFTASKQSQTALLKWSTTQDQNTLNFTVQHSINRINWTELGTLQAEGNFSEINNYNFVHNNPVIGLNYYRIVQKEFDNSSNYSNIRMLQFTKTNEPFIIVGNPVTNGMLMVQVNAASNLSLYTTDGKLIWLENIHSGTKTFDISRYPKGTYILKANNTAKKIVLQ
jgi:hypothetical protein